jgi:hypothetical protein
VKVGWDEVCAEGLMPRFAGLVQRPIPVGNSGDMNMRDSQLQTGRGGRRTYVGLFRELSAFLLDSHAHAHRELLHIP